VGAIYRHWLAGPAEGRSSPPRDLCTGVFAMCPAQTVLIVDDNQRNREALAELLKDDCDLLLARDGPTAIEIAMREDISLVLLAVPLAGTDGYETLRQLKSDAQTADIGVILITDMAPPGHEERGLLLGAADYVHMPIRSAILRARVNVHLKLARQRRELELLSLEDGLTGIANRRFFDLALDRAMRQSKCQQQSLGLALFDVDHFKQYNDFYGHARGDDALRQVATILRGFARRPDDVAARFGGEEFVLLIPAANDFAVMLERLRLAVLDRGIAHARSPVRSCLTLSAGGVVLRHTASFSAAELVSHADRLLYRAKLAGRNRIMLDVID
jgi:diguanylate cyclase (GGDEF)-like protein